MKPTLSARDYAPCGECHACRYGISVMCNNKRRIIDWKPSAPVMTPGGVQFLYSWHPVNEYAQTVDESGKLYTWKRTQLLPAPEDAYDVG